MPPLDYDVDMRYLLIVFGLILLLMSLLFTATLQGWVVFCAISVILIATLSIVFT